MSVRADGLVALRLVGLPTELYVRNRRLLDDLVHELKMVRAGQMTGLDVDPDLAGAIESILAAYAGPRDVAFKTARAAYEAGEPAIDLELEVPVDSVGPVKQIIGLLERAEELARRGVLLTVPAPPEIWRLRRWVTAELERQIAGQEPVPFDEDAAA